MTFKIEWVDHGRDPECAPDPAYPEGKDVKVPVSVAKHCKVELPYPAKRCGHFLVTCERCGLKTAITTAGRPDDPRSIEMPCWIHLAA